MEHFTQFICNGSSKYTDDELDKQGFVKQKLVLSKYMNGKDTK